VLVNIITGNNHPRMVTGDQNINNKKITVIFAWMGQGGSWDETFVSILVENASIASAQRFL